MIVIVNQANTNPHAHRSIFKPYDSFTLTHTILFNLTHQTITTPSYSSLTLTHLITNKSLTQMKNHARHEPC